MAAPKRPRFGSLQFYPRKRIEKAIPSVNWSTIPLDSKNNGLMGFIVYKAAMATALVKDTTDKSMTAGKKIFIPVTILEAPHMKIFSVRFYNKGLVVKDVIVSNDKELKHIVKVPKTLAAFDSMIPKEFDDIRVMAYTLVKSTSVKKTPDISEIAINAQDKLAFVKSIIGKELTLKDFAHTDLIDARGLTTGKGLVGPMKRFGISKKGHKSEKGVRRPGSLAPWHPARVTFHTPHAGQLGMFTRVQYNNKIITSGNISEKDINPGTGYKNYGKVRTSYLIVKGSIQGPPKRQILLTQSFRPTKMMAKTKLEFQELIQ